MHLAQHHFQLQSRYFEGAVAFAVAHLFYRPYGIAGLDLDAEALRNGTVAVLHARGMMPDGLAFHFPDADPPPEPRDIRELLSPTQDTHLVLLTLPPYRPDRANCVAAGADGRSARYSVESSEIPDETTGRDVKAVNVGRKNFRLRLDVEPADDAVALPLARVRRDGAGNLVYDPEYVPPLLQIGASVPLLALVRRLVDILEAKTETLARKRTGDAGGGAEPLAQDVPSFWVTHAINSSLGPLRHQLEVRRGRPEQLYLELARLAGALCTFGLDSHPRSLPAYDHDRAGESFIALERHIRTHLDLVVPTAHIVVPLAAVSPYLRQGTVDDTRCYGPSQWFLGVRSATRGAQLAAAVPKVVKLCSAKHIARLVKEAFPGLTLQHAPMPPASVAPRADTHYFRVDQAGPCWEAIRKSHDVGLYVPEQLGDSECELVVVPESLGARSV